MFMKLKNIVQSFSRAKHAKLICQLPTSRSSRHCRVTDRHLARPERVRVAYDWPQTFSNMRHSSRKTNLSNFEYSAKSWSLIMFESQSRQHTLCGVDHGQ